MNTYTLIAAGIVIISLTIGGVTATDGDWVHDGTINHTEDGPINVTYGETTDGVNGYWDGYKVVLNESYVNETSEQRTTLLLLHELGHADGDPVSSHYINGSAPYDGCNNRCVMDYDSYSTETPVTERNVTNTTERITSYYPAFETRTIDTPTLSLAIDWWRDNRLSTRDLSAIIESWRADNTPEVVFFKGWMADLPHTPDRAMIVRVD